MAQRRWASAPVSVERSSSVDMSFGQSTQGSRIGGLMRTLILFTLGLGSLSSASAFRFRLRFFGFPSTLSGGVGRSTGFPSSSSSSSSPSSSSSSVSSNSSSSPRSFRSMSPTSTQTLSSWQLHFFAIRPYSNHFSVAKLTDSAQL